MKMISKEVERARTLAFYQGVKARSQGLPRDYPGTTPEDPVLVSRWEHGWDEEERRLHMGDGIHPI